MTRYLGIIESIRTGGQSGVDRSSIRHAIRCGVPVGGWVPAGNTAEIFAGGRFVDAENGISDELLRAGDFIQTTVENVDAYLTKLAPEIRASAAHLLVSARKDAANPAIRTELQVIDTEGTLIVTTDSPALKDGTVRMEEFAARYAKPCFAITVKAGGIVDTQEIDRCREWLNVNTIRRLNVGGPRASHEQVFGLSIERMADEVFDRLYGSVSEHSAPALLRFV